MNHPFPLIVCLSIALGILCQTAPLLRAEDEDLTTGQMPLPLEMKEPRFTAPGLIHWLGDPHQRADQVKTIEWTNDGARLYARTNVDIRRVQVWSGSEHATKLRLLGFLPLSSCGVSKDGRWLAGSQWIEHPANQNESQTFGLYHADSLTGVWESHSTDFSNVERVAFSRDGKYLIVAGADGKGAYAVSVLDAATGHRLKKFSYQLPKGPPPAVGDVMPPVKTRDLEVGQNCLLLPPIFDEKERILRVSFPSMETTPVTEPMKGDPQRGQSLVLSNDDRWLAAHTSSEYQVLEETPTGYVQRFTGSVRLQMDENGFNWGDQLAHISFSPDSRRLLVSSGQKFKAINLSDQKVIYSGDQGMDGEFAPDGETFWTIRPTFYAFNTTTWATLPNPSPGAESSTEILHFSPQGFRLLLGNSRSAEVWEINGSKPDFYLKPPHCSCQNSFLWSSNGQEAYGSCPDSYLRWKIPAQSTSPESQSIVGDPLFQLPASWQAMSQERKNKHYPFISGHDPVTDTCLLSISLMPTMTELRQPSRPAVVRHFKVQQIPFLKGFFGTEGKEIFYNYEPPAVTHSDGELVNAMRPSVEPGIYGYHLETDVLRSPENPDVQHGYVIGVDRKNRRVVTLSRTTGISVLDEKTLQLVKKLYPPSPLYWSQIATLSPDGRWFFCRLKDHQTSVFDEGKLALVDLQEGKLAAAFDALDVPVSAAEFSADSAFLALGHTTGPVSIWKVADMVAAKSAPDIALSDHLVQSTDAGRSFRNPFSPWTKGPPEPFKPKSGGTWAVDDQGSITNPLGINFHVGQWFVDEAPLKPVSQVHRLFTKDNSYLTLRTNLRNEDGQLRLSRSIDLQRLDRISYIDRWQNLSTQPRKVKISLVWGLGVDPASLRCEDGSPPSLQGNLLNAGGALNQLAALIPATETQPAEIVCLGLGSEGAPQRAVIRWDAARKAVVSEWTLDLEPYQSRLVYQQLMMQPTAPEGPQIAKLFDSIHRFGAGRFDAGIVERLINYSARPDEREALEKRSPSPGFERDGSQKDALGFRWINAGTFDGMESELQADRILSLLVNNAPVSFMGNGPNEATITPGHGYDRSTPVLVEGVAPDAPVLVQRRTLFTPEESCLVTHDTFTNTSDHTITIPVDLLVRSKSQIVSAVALNGKTLNLSQPVAAKDGSERVALIFGGEQKPGVALGLGGKGALISATLRQPTESTVLLHYDLTLKPGEKVALAHVASPRPIGAYSRPTDVLGMRSPLEFYKLNGPDIVPPANWIPATSP